MRTHALRLRQHDRSSTTSRHRPQPAYLLADSVPFSHNFDFISVLESFVDLAADVLSEASGLRQHEQEIARLRGELAQSVVALHRLENEVVERAVSMLYSQSDPTLEAVAVRLDRVTQDLCLRSRLDLQARFDAQTTSLCAAIREHEERMIFALQRFFLESELEVTNERFSVILTEDRYRIGLRQLVEGNITVRFEVAAEKTFWSQPRRVSDLVPGLQLGVGMRRKTFSRALRLETRALGDYMIGRVLRDGNTMDISLRKNHETHDSLQLLLTHGGDGVSAQVRHANAPHAPFDIPYEHAERVAALWSALDGVCVADKAARSSVSRVSLGDEHVLRGQGAEDVVRYLVAAYRPIVAELLHHGAASGELSLKRDLGDGRREERFVTLAHLIAKVSRLAPEQRARLRGLGLDRAVPRKSGTGLTPVRIAQPLPTRIENTNAPRR